MIRKNFTFPFNTYVRRNHRNADRGHVKFPKHSWSICQSFESTWTKVRGFAVRKFFYVCFARAQLRNDYAHTHSWPNQQKPAVNGILKNRENDIKLTNFDCKVQVTENGYQVILLKLA